MLHKLTLTNFQQHKLLEVTFTSGLNAIIGANDTGKSTILRGVMFALIGSQGVKENAQQIWNNQASKSEEFSVGLTLTLPSVGRVTITRTPTGVKVISEAGVLLASGTTPVTKLVEEAIGIPLKDLRTLCCSYQKETDGLLSMGAASLQKKVEDLSKMSTIDKVLSFILADLNKLEGALSALPQTDELTALYGKRTDGETLLRTLSDAEESADEEAGLWKEHLAAINSSVTLMQEHSNKVRQFTQQRETLLGQIDRVNTQESEQLTALQALPHVTPLVISDLETQKVTLTAELSSLSVLAKAHTDRDKYQKRIGELAFRVADSVEAREILSNKEKELEATKQEQAIAINTVTHLFNLQQQWQHTLKSGTCPTCLQDTGRCDKDHVNEELKSVASQLEKAEEKKNTWNYEVSLMIGVVNKLKSRVNLQAEAEYAHLLTLIEGELPEYSSERLKKIDESVLALNHRIRDKNAALLSKTKLESSLESLASQKLALRGNLNSVEDGLTNLDATTLPYPTLERARETLTVAEQQLESSKNTLHNLRTQLSTLNEQLKGLTLQINQLEKAKKQREDSLQDQYEIVSLQTYLRKNRARLSAQIWGGILNYSSSLISNTTGGKFSNLQRSDKGVFTLDKHGEPVDLLYGANESVVAVALTVALSKTFFGNGLFLLLDEPTAYADNTTAAAVAGMLKSLNMQVVIVSHRVGDVNQCDNVIEIGE